ncbi:CrcB family protein [Nonomuraea sp. NPDC050663]|uniref:CrcB family protein n=1 Tax=Nonomuraea sp. NPDC050663 TaxID=3364370 RepID=UPI0037ABC93D
MGHFDKHITLRERAEAAVLDRGRHARPRHPGLTAAALLDIAVGGALGTLARWLITEALPGARTGFPWGTLAVNLLGCLLVGIITTYLLKGRPRPFVRPLLVTGYLGGFTTFSHLIAGMDLLGGGQAVTYTLVSVVGGWIVLGVGLWLGGLLPHHAEGSS